MAPSCLGVVSFDVITTALRFAKARSLEEIVLISQGAKDGFSDWLKRSLAEGGKQAHVYTRDDGPNLVPFFHLYQGPPYQLIVEKAKPWETFWKRDF